MNWCVNVYLVTIYNMKTRLVSTMAAALAALALSAAPTLPFKGDGTVDSPYLIQSKADLVAMSELSCTENYNDIVQGKVTIFEGCYFKMTADIDLEFDDEFIGICCTDKSTCARELRFKGVFDGNGHTIHNMKLRGVAWAVDPEDNNGVGTPSTTNSHEARCFVGRLGDGGKVLNLNIADDCVIEGYNRTAGVVGYAYDGSTITNCRNYADIIAYGDYAGGIVAYNGGATVSDCYNAGNIVSATYCAGGIVGQSNSGDLERCVNAGNVSISQFTTKAPDGWAGGIIGLCNSSLSGVVDCVNLGAVSSTANAGGIAGSMKTMRNVVNYGMVTCDDATKCGAIAGTSTAGFGATTSSTYYDSQILTTGAVAGNAYSGTTASTTALLTSGDLLSGFDAALWSFEKGCYPMLKQFAAEVAALNGRRVVATLADGQTVANVTSDVALAAVDGLEWSLNPDAKFKIVGNLVKSPSAAMTTPDTLTATFGNYVKRLPLICTVGSTQTGPFEGEGTAESPYLLSTKDDLVKLSELTSTNDAAEAPSKQSFAGKYFRLANDIDMEYTDDFKGISVAASFTLSTYIHFDGVIDGDGHTIHRLKIDGVKFSKSPDQVGDGEFPTTDNAACAAETYYKSFVGRLGNGGVIRNLNMAADCDIVAFTSVGGFAGVLGYGALIENCRNYADVTGYNTCVGGIAGTVSEGARITGCYNAGTVTTGTLGAGGIAGVNDGKIDNCVNAGNILGTQLSTNVPSGLGFLNQVGGIAGSMTKSTSSISECLNVGSIVGEVEVGGLLGTFGTAEKCLNYGIVRATNEAQYYKSGNLYGNKANMSGKTASQLYFDGQINRVQAISIETFTFEGELVTVPVTTENLISGEELPGLGSDKWDYRAGAYPVMKQFADEPLVKCARTVILKMFANMSAAGDMLPITLVAEPGVEWSADERFNIDNGAAVPLKDGLGTITATALDGGYVKMFTINIINVSSVDEIEGNTKEIISEQWFDLAGRQLTDGMRGYRIPAVKVVRYSDGSSSTAKTMF